MFKRTKYIEKIFHAFLDVGIVVLIGSRQVGKTSIIKSIDYDRKSLFLNGQDPEVALLFQKLSTLTSYLKSNLNDSLDGYLLVDEFQYIDNVSVMLKLLVDAYPRLRIVCTGSSSLDILQKVHESIAGRVRVIEVYSLDFAEYLQFSNNELFELYNKYTDTTDQIVVDRAIVNLLNEYLVYGGMPRAALSKDLSRKVSVLDDIYKTYLQHDVRSYIKNEDSVGFNRMLKMLASQIGGLVNIHELSNSSGLSYKKCADYLWLLEQMYIIKLIEPFATNKRKVVGKMKKVYFNDIGLRNIVLNSFNPFDSRVDNGNLWENFSYLSIVQNLNAGSGLNYYRTLDGAEVDFVINNSYSLIAVEVKLKNLQKPLPTRSLKSFTETEKPALSIMVNQDLNLTDGHFRYIPGILLAKLKF